MVASRVSAIQTRFAQMRLLPRLITLTGGVMVLLASVQTVHAVSTGGDLLELFIDFILISTPGVVLLYSGFWIADSAIDSQYYPRLIAWLLGGVAIMFGFIFLRALHPGVTVEWSLGTQALALAIGSIGGLLIGIQESKATMRTEQLSKQNKTLEEYTEQLEERERTLERYETITETAGDPVYTLDSEGCFTFVNDAMIELTGYQEDTLLDEYTSLVMDMEDVERGEELIRSLLSSDRDRGTFEMDIVTASGRRIPVENHLGILPFDEEFQGTVGILRDLTERKEREVQLERQNERLDSFTSVVSHDLRNPLNVATGRLELAQDDCESEHLADVDHALHRMETLIDDLLELARHGEAVGEQESITLTELGESCWENVETVEAALTVEIEQTITADVSRLEQVFENLFRNAIEHGGDDVTITVGELDDGFYIEDDGPGIPADEREEIFEAGYSTSDEGTGFGLSIVKEVTEAHGWEIRVTEGADGGARFEITGVEFV